MLNAVSGKWKNLGVENPRDEFKYSKGQIRKEVWRVELRYSRDTKSRKLNYEMIGGWLLKIYEW